MIKKITETQADRTRPVSGPGGPGAPPGHPPPPPGPPPAVDAVVPSGKKRSEPESSSTPSSSSGFEHDVMFKESSSTSLSSSGFEYQVFLSFRGPDTRGGFTDHLFSKLANAGIVVFKDDENLYAGEEIKPALKEAIQQSRISIVVFSKDYASSKSCLMELVQMWECRESKGQTIIPIFYDVSPLDVIHQAGDFGRRFNLHETAKVDSDTIETWREVLRRIGGLNGFEQENVNRHESQLAKKVVARVRQVLKMDDQLVTDKLVGIDHHVDEMMKKLGVAYSEGQVVGIRGEEVRVVGICGMPGVGKTTLAKVVFNKMHKLFDACSFLEGSRSEGVLFAQQILIADLLKIRPEPLISIDEGIQKIAGLFSNMKVLIVLDDVREDEQIKALAGKLTWFGPGSRIIVTTTNKNVLNAFDVGAVDVQTVEEYELQPMSEDHALQLFCEHAFAGESPEGVSEYDSLSKDIVEALGGIPLDVVRHALFLRGKRDIDTWKTTLDLLQENPENRQLPF